MLYPPSTFNPPSIKSPSAKPFCPKYPKKVPSFVVKFICSSSVVIVPFVIFMPGVVNVPTIANSPPYSLCSS